MLLQFLDESLRFLERFLLLLIRATILIKIDHFLLLLLSSELFERALILFRLGH